MDKGDHLFYGEVVKSCGIFEVHEISIRTIADTYFVGVDTETHKAYVFSYDQLNECLFNFRIDAANYVKVKQEECGEIKLHKIKEEEECETE